MCYLFDHYSTILYRVLHVFDVTTIIQGGSVVMVGTNALITTPLNFKPYNVLYCDAIDIAADLTVADRDATIQVTYSDNQLKIITKTNLDTIKYYMIVKQ